MTKERERKEKQLGPDGVSITRRRFLKRAGAVGVGVAALAAIGPAVVAVTSNDAKADDDGSESASTTSITSTTSQTSISSETSGPSETSPTSVTGEPSTTSGPSASSLLSGSDG